MSNKNLTYNEILKALDCCKREVKNFGNCLKCLKCLMINLPDCYEHDSIRLSYVLIELLSDLITRQQAEIEELFGNIEKLNVDFF